MRILIVTQYFWPENFRINEVAKSLVARGHDIDVLTGKPNYPDGKIFSGYHAFGILQEKWQGTRVFRVPLMPRGLRSGTRLFLNYLSFVLSGVLFGSWVLRNSRPDIIFVYAPSPLLQALPALFIGWAKRVPVVVYVQDLWPESLEATGYVHNTLIIGAVRMIVRFIYQRADLILVSSIPFKDSVAQYSPRAPVIYYPNSVDPSFENPDIEVPPLVPALSEGFCVVFAGNVGAAQAVHVILEAASLLSNYSEIRFVVVGSGSEIGWMQSQISKFGLRNVFLAGRFPVQAMPHILSKAAVLLVTLAKNDIFAATVPNKIQAYMAVGRPIVAAINGEGARIVREANAGLTVPAEDGSALANAILELYRLPKLECERLGANGRNYYRYHYHHEQLISDLIARLTETLLERI